MKYRHEAVTSEQHTAAAHGSPRPECPSCTHIRAKTFQRKGVASKLHFDTTPFYIVIGYAYAYACSNIF